MDMNTKLDKIALTDLFEKPEVIRDQVIADYKAMLGNSPVWPVVVEQMQGVEAISRRVARNRQKLIMRNN